MLNWEIDPSALKPLVPIGTELDFHNGKTFVSIVGFMFLNTRILGLPIPWHRNFEELNLRFYVRRNEPPWSGLDQSKKRGVAFISELVPRQAIAAIARWGYNENYSAVPMDHKIATDLSDGSIDVEYSWNWQGCRQRLSATGCGVASPLTDDSLEQFIAEHYWGYSQQRNQTSFEYQVKHPSWNVSPADSVTFECDCQAVYGKTFASTLAKPPDSAFIADGSPVTVSKPRRIK